jgi:peptidoglycan/xylan/chitin deacetylase (PgdA/CDA1 family)/ketosteroid isomerase-like protein
MNKLLAFALPLLAIALASAAQAEGRRIVISVDDLPIASAPVKRTAAQRLRIMNRWLTAFSKHGVRAVGLVRAAGIDRDRALLRRWLDSGHELGNHSFGHPSLSDTPLGVYLADIERGRAALARLLGPRRRVRFFRFPYLREGETPGKLRGVRAYLKRTGQINLPVTIDTSDYTFEKRWVKARRAARRDPAAKARLQQIGQDYMAHLKRAVRRHARLGDSVLGRPRRQAEVPEILLLHLNEVGADHLDQLLTWLKRDGYRVVSADEAIKHAIIRKPTHEYLGRYGVSLWWRLRVTRFLAQQEAVIRRGMQRSVRAWNRGDLKAFVSDYAEDAHFVTAKSVTVGRAKVLARYQRRYRDRAAMGTLKLTIQRVSLHVGQTVTSEGNVEPVLPTVASVIGRWSITRKRGEVLKGATTMVLSRRRGRWVIVEDHSS